VVNTEGCEKTAATAALQSNCMSSQKVPTEFGDKTAVHPPSCNQDFSCLVATVPPSVTVQTPQEPAIASQDPRVGISTNFRAQAVVPGDPFRIYMPGVGGTGC